MVYVIQVCRQLASRIRMELSSILILLAMVHVIQVCRQFAGRIRMELSSILILLASCQLTCMTYTIAECTVKNS